MCYPWAVVEVKHAKVDQADKSFCYRQAANAAAAALQLQESLYKTSHEYPAGPGLRPLAFLPVVAFTCIGPKLKVWLAYVDYTVDPKHKVRTLSCTNTEADLTRARK